MLDLLCATIQICSLELAWICSALDLLCVGSGLGSALCWIYSVLDLLSEACLDLLCVGSALCWIWSGSALC